MDGMDLERGDTNQPQTPPSSGSPTYSDTSRGLSSSPADRGRHVTAINYSSSTLHTDKASASLLFGRPARSSLQADRSWDDYVNRARVLDREMLSTWTSSMDALLVFAGLFSAILTAFLAISIPSLRPNATLSDPSGPTSADPNTASSDSGPSTRIVLIHFCWFISLSLSILTAAVAMLAKSWCLEYSRQSSAGSRFEQAQRRQARYTGLVAWRLPEVMDLIPSLLYIAIILFMIGLCQFLADLHIGIAIAVFALFSLGLFIGIGISVLAAMISDCPYRTPFIPIITNISKALLPRPIIRLISYSTTSVKRMSAQLHRRCSNGIHHLNRLQGDFVHSLASGMHRWDRKLKDAKGRVNHPISARDIVVLCSWPLFRIMELFFTFAYTLKWLWDGTAYDASPEMDQEDSTTATEKGSWCAQRSVGSEHAAEALGWWIKSSGDPQKVTEALSLLHSVIHDADDRRVLIRAGAARELAQSMAAICNGSQGAQDDQLCGVGNALRFLLGPHPDEVTNPTLRREINTILSPGLRYLISHQRTECQVLGVSLQTCLSSEADFSYELHLLGPNRSSTQSTLLLLHCALDNARRRYHRSRAPAWVRIPYQTDFRHVHFINAVIQQAQTQKSSITKDIANAYLHALRYELALSSKSICMDDPPLPDLLLSATDCLDEVLYSAPATTAIPLVMTPPVQQLPRPDATILGRAVLIESITTILAIIHSVNLPQTPAHRADLKEFVLRQMRQRTSKHEIQRHALLAFHKLAQRDSDYNSQARRQILVPSIHVIEHATVSPDDVLVAINVLTQICRRDRSSFIKSMLDDHHRIFGQLAQQADHSTPIREALLRLFDVMVDNGRLCSPLSDLLGILPASALVVLLVQSLEQGHGSEQVVRFGLVNRLIRHPIWAHALAIHPTFLPYVTDLQAGPSRTIRRLITETVLNLWIATCGAPAPTGALMAYPLLEPQRQAWVAEVVSSGFLREFTSRISDLDILSIPRVNEWIPLLQGLMESYPEELHRLLHVLREVLNQVGGWRDAKKEILAREYLTLIEGLPMLQSMTP